MSLKVGFKNFNEALNSVVLFLIFFGRLYGPLYENDVVFQIIIALSSVGLMFRFKAFMSQPKGYKIWAIGFLILYIISSLWAVDATRTYTNFVATAGRFIVLFYIFSCMTGIEEIKRVIKIFFYAVLANGVFILIVFGPGSLIAARMNEVNSEAGNSNVIGMSSASAIILDEFVVRENSAKTRMCRLPLYCLLGILVLLAGSKKAIFMLIFVFGLMYVLSHRNKIATVIVVGISVIIIYRALMVVPILYEIVGNRIESLLEGFLSMLSLGNVSVSNLMNTSLNSSDRARMTLILYGFEWFKQKPIWGYGMANFITLYEKVALKGLYAHNNYIEIAVGLGVIGLVWYYALYLRILKQSLKNIKNSREGRIAFTIVLLCILLDVGLVSYLEISVQFLLSVAFLLSHYSIAAQKVNTTHQI